MYLSDVMTIPANIAGLPGISGAMRASRKGCLWGLQVIGPALGDAAVLRAAHAYEQATQWHKMRPAL